MSDGPLFESAVDDDDWELDDEADDRAVLRHIWTRAEIGDLGTGDGWHMLARRYPDDPDLALLATAMLAEEYGTVSLVALERLITSTPDSHLPMLRVVVCVAQNHTGEGELKEKVLALARSIGATMDQEDAYPILWDFEQRTLAEGEARTRDGKPWGDRPEPGEKVDYAGALACATAAPRRYSAKETFTVRDKIEHSKFGLGVVVDASPGRITVLFPDGSKTLVCAQ